MRGSECAGSRALARRRLRGSASLRAPSRPERGETGGGGQRRVLTREGLDGADGPVLVGVVHEGVAGLEQDLSRQGQLSVPEELPEVFGGDGGAQVPDVKLVHHPSLPREPAAPPARYPALLASSTALVSPPLPLALTQANVELEDVGICLPKDSFKFVFTSFGSE